MPLRRRSKYGAVRTTVDGITFDSRKEARRYSELRLLEKAGEITHLLCQVPYPLTAHALDGSPQFVGSYVADFSYVETRTHLEITEDVKGFRTPLYRWKAKHFAVQYGRAILET